MSHEFLSFILAVALIIVAAKLSGYLSIRIGQPSVLGELLAGLILGPTLLNMYHWPTFAHDEMLAEVIKMMAELGVIFLMMLAGLELHLNELLDSGKVAAVSGTLGVITPLLVGMGLAMAFGAGLAEAVFIGLALSATSVSISAQTLMELNVLRSPVGLALLGAAVFDDILVILLLSIAAILFGGAVGGLGAIGMTIFWMVAYLVGASLIGLFVLPTVIRLANRLPVSQSIIAFVIVITLLSSWAAEVIGGMAAITGAFLVGLFLARTPYKNRIEEGVSALAFGFFVPIFFVNIGLEVNMRGITGNLWWFAIALTIAAVLTKIIGCGGGALLTGFSRMDSLRLGIGMVSRGEVGLIVASFAVSQGLLSHENFSIVIFMVIIATLVTPPMLRAVYSNNQEPTKGDQTPAPA
ncbi:MAG: cation:proton antiporter [Caldilineaceae bacterium]|nr:cation:proton antiporter [Caldilineaceae bacterium]